jgi:hypothetical protein
MNQGELERLLKQLETPAPPGSDAVERAVQKARATFSSEPLRLLDRPEGSGRPDLLRDLLPSFLGALLLLLVWGKFDPTSRGGLNSVKTVSSVTTELGETLHVFPEELVGIVETMGQSRLVLEASSGPRSSQPLAVDLLQNGRRTRILTFSGKEMDLDLGGDHLKLAFLALPDGKIEVKSDNSVWRSDSNSSLNGYRVEAKLLDFKG